MKKYSYFHKFNGKIEKKKTNSFVEAHNSTFWSGKKKFYDNENGNEIDVAYRLIQSTADWDALALESLQESEPNSITFTGTLKFQI